MATPTQVRLHAMHRTVTLPSAARPPIPHQHAWWAACMHTRAVVRPHAHIVQVHAPPLPHVQKRARAGPLTPPCPTLPHHPQKAVIKNADMSEEMWVLGQGGQQAVPARPVSSLHVGLSACPGHTPMHEWSVCDALVLNALTRTTRRRVGRA